MVGGGEMYHGHPPALASVYYIITCNRVLTVVGEQTTFTTDNGPLGIQ